MTEPAGTTAQAAAILCGSKVNPHLGVSGRPARTQRPSGGQGLWRVVRFVITHVHRVNFCPYQIFPETVSLGVALS